MKKTSFLFVLMLLLAACGPASRSQAETISGCSATLDSLSSLLNGYDLPAYFQTEHPVKQGGEFDVMQYFTVLDHLSMQPGYVLDYIYHHDEMVGYPVLYVRPVDQSPYATEADLTAAGGATNYLDFVQADDTPDAYFQFVLLANTGGRFYLDWHANYNDNGLVCNRASVNSITASLDGSYGYRISLLSRLKAFLLTGVEPSVSIGTDTVAVRVVTFTRWGGFYEQTYTITRSAPHTIKDFQEKNLVPYDCGVMF
jgi:hypothetical protein